MRQPWCWACFKPMHFFKPTTPFTFRRKAAATCVVVFNTPSISFLDDNHSLAGHEYLSDMLPYAPAPYGDMHM